MKTTNMIDRKDFIKVLSLMTGAAILPGCKVPMDKIMVENKMRLGLVTYLWGKDWDIPTLIKNCTTAGLTGVELRIQHAHGVTTELTKAERDNVKKQFADSKVEVVGMGTNQKYDYVDPDELAKSIEVTKDFIKLSHDIGGTGVKVKPDGFHDGVPKEKTIEQIGKSLNIVGKYAAEFGQTIRLEVHGHGTQELPVIKQIMEYVDSPNARVCWNSNEQDLWNEGLEYNFNLVKKWFGDTVHIRELNSEKYPFQELLSLFKKMNYEGWILLECRTKPEDLVKALIEQRKIFEKMIAKV
ncbi:MAG: sugar phosphate isomerase/epimerase [Melioribacteraceae bacterium]|nr:sugar phosphate isomerase/epimerase [Melioribacteraceae bacterium]